MDTTTLAHKAVACQHWKWTTGMMTTTGELVWVEGNNPFIPWVVTVAGHRTSLKNSGELLPDLSHPATLGCLLDLVRKAWMGRYTVCGEDQLRPEVLVDALSLAEEAFQEE